MILLLFQLVGCGKTIIISSHARKYKNSLRVCGFIGWLTVSVFSSATYFAPSLDHFLENVEYPQFL